MVAGDEGQCGGGRWVTLKVQDEGDGTDLYLGAYTNLHM